MELDFLDIREDATKAYELLMDTMRLNDQIGKDNPAVPTSLIWVTAFMKGVTDGISVCTNDKIKLALIQIMQSTLEDIKPGKGE